ncbi:type II toxin-antitoxin system death-on-curing family toxin [Lacticaseibacillus zhaodongensis]|uniref:type II toxin-antitoxin system death-on-curing family toxin n=1 Tax=Lacticaseibacillus zhaodongensis TaxID=2668065 RepID=UPI0012D31348|nr:type II toxin-antitoxin system death-on-curing family toxin [Lacticaseibacillus zhaodongensis]
MEYLTKIQLISLNTFIQQKQGTRANIRDARALDYIIQSAHQEVFGRVLYPTVIDLASFYFINVIKKHVFNDANKRTAVLALFMVLRLNHFKYKNNHESRLMIGELAIRSPKKHVHNQ